MTCWTGRHNRPYVVIPPSSHTDAEPTRPVKASTPFSFRSAGHGLSHKRPRQKAGIITSVGYTLRYFGFARLLRQFLANETLAMISINRWGGMPGVAWWRQMARSGGQLVEQTTHQVDMVRYVTGKEITSVYADYALRVMGDWEWVDIPDVQSLAMKLEDGTPVSLTTSCQMHKGGGDSSMHFLLDGSRVELKGVTIATHPEGDPAIDGEHGQETNIDQAFLDAINKKARPGAQLLRRRHEDSGCHPGGQRVGPHRHARQGGLGLAARNRRRRSATECSPSLTLWEGGCCLGGLARLRPLPRAGATSDAPARGSPRPAPG